MREITRSCSVKMDNLGSEKGRDGYFMSSKRVFLVQEFKHKESNMRSKLHDYLT